MIIEVFLGSIALASVAVAASVLLTVHSIRAGRGPSRLGLVISGMAVGAFQIEMGVLALGGLWYVASTQASLPVILGPQARLQAEVTRRRLPKSRSAT